LSCANPQFPDTELFMYGHVLSILLWLHLWLKNPASKRSWGFSGSMGVPICADRWSLGPVREGKDMGKAWEKMDALYYIKLCYVILYYILFSSFYLSTSIAMGKQWKTTQATRVSCPYQPKDTNASCLASPKHSDFLWSHRPHPRNIVRWFSQPKTSILFRDLQAFISFPCYVCWLTTPVN
jgi:hypothetical protein